MDEAQQARWDELVRRGERSNDCDYCASLGTAAITPSHSPVRSGHGQHCTCSACF